MPGRAVTRSNGDGWIVAHVQGSYVRRLGEGRFGKAGEGKERSKTVVMGIDEGRRDMTKRPLPERALVMSHAAARSRLVLLPGRLGRGATRPDGRGSEREGAQD